MSGKPWTGAEIIDACRWYGEGMKMLDIGRILGRTTLAVRQKLSEKGATRSPGESLPRGSALQLAKENLAFEIALAKAERRTSPPFKVSPLVWR